MIRSVVIAVPTVKTPILGWGQGAQSLINTLRDHKAASMLASDHIENQRLEMNRLSGSWFLFSFYAVRLPRRLFRNRLRAYHNSWMLTHGARLENVI